MPCDIINMVRLCSEMQSKNYNNFCRQVIINIGLQYIRPLITGKLIYKDKNIVNSLSTLIKKNKNGDILTTLTNAELFLIEDDNNEVFPNILNEIDNAPKERQKKKIEEKYGIKDNSIVGIHNVIIDIAKNPGKLNIIKHPYLDLAIVKIENKKNILVDEFPKFVNKPIDIGTSVCNLGFAFPEYKTFEYDKESKRIISTNEVMNFPVFPTEGMITRNIIDKQDNLSMIETSNEVITGTQGGVLLNKEGNVLGMLAGTNIIKSTIPGDDFNMRLGISINSQTIIKFLKDNNIEFEEVKWKIQEETS